uniref:Sugar phosphate transporter domain-containing protein n=1 Tax=Gouania willdenowi TaxID=441366 RepID=A0A8C5EEP2_GOUWI
MLPVEPAAPPGPDQGPEHPGLSRLLSALFYGSCSFLITVINKTVLTSFRFPSYLCLGIGQMVTTVIVLYVAKMSKTVQFQDFDRGVLLKIFPLPLLYVGNHITGLASTKKLRKTFPKRAVCSVAAIVFGAVVAASSDLAFDMEAYTFILFNDAFTAAYGVYTKKKLGDQSLGKYGVLFYNAIIIVIPTLMLSAYTGDLHKAFMFEDWVETTFVLCFLMSCVMGSVAESLILFFNTSALNIDTIMFPLPRFVLMYSIVLCSYYNSALTTTVVGALKNVVVAYVGIFIGGDYLFSWTNFLGLSICMSGGVVYSYLTFINNKSTTTAHEQNSKLQRTQVIQL